MTRAHAIVIRRAGTGESMADAIPTTDGIAGEQRQAPGGVFTLVVGAAVERTGGGRDGRPRADP